MTAPEEDDPLADKYGDAPRVQSVAVTGRVWTDVSALSPELKDTTVRPPPPLALQLSHFNHHQPQQPSQ